MTACSLFEHIFLDKGLPYLEDDSTGDDGSSQMTVRADGTANALLPLCPQLQILNLRLEKVSFEEK